MSEPIQLRSAGVEWREIDGEVIALDTEASTYMAINGSGAAIWPELTAGTTRDQLVAKLREEFGIDEAVAAADVDAFVEALEQQNLLR